MDADKFYVSYNTVHKLVKGLAEKIEASGFDPDVIVAIGSGGFIPARIIKTFINRPIYAVGISYYGMDNKHKTHPTKIQWIDEVDDTRATLAYCVGELLSYQPEEIAVLVLHNKLKKKDVDFPPEIKRYYPALEIGDVWIKYPWDAADIDEHTANEAEMLRNMTK